jgi:hypothetical protein
MKPKRMRWVGHVACMSRREMYTGFSGENEGKETVWEIKMLVGG